MVACVSVNWNWPGDVSVATPSNGQALNGAATFPVAMTLKTEPYLLVNASCSGVLGSVLVLASVGDAIGPLPVSYSWAVEKMLWEEFFPPVASTFPLGSKVAVV